MKRIKRVFFWFALVLCLFLGLWLAQDNTEKVTITLLGFSLKDQSLGLWLILMLGGGVMLGLLASLPVVWRLAGKNRRLVREVAASKA